MLAELTAAGAALIDPAYADSINVAMNWYFIAVSVFLLTFVGWFVSAKIVEPRLGSFKMSKEQEEDLSGEDVDGIQTLQPVEKKGLIWALISVIIGLVLAALLVVLPNSPMRGSDEIGSYMDTIVQSPFMSSLVPIIAILFFIPGVVYGIVTKSIKNDKDVAGQMTDTMASMGMFIVLAFAAGQFVAYFTESNLGLVIGVYGAELLDSLSLTGVPLLIGFMLVTALINLFIGSASAKWALMAPIFVPILMQLGYSPELTTMAYRVADSSTNIITRS